MATPFFLFALYTASILWRVSWAEQHFFGRSDLIPLSVSPPKYRETAVPESFGQKTLHFSRNGVTVSVWRQEVNGFQHVFGSALAAYEWGEKPADVLFCANEFMEATFDWDGITQEDSLDRRKDLSHNQLGRQIGLAVRQSGLRGTNAENAMAYAVLDAMRTSSDYYHHYKDPRIPHIPTEAALGCPGLPEKNIFNVFQRG